jgi:hypothetical protein
MSGRDTSVLDCVDLDSCRMFSVKCRPLFPNIRFLDRVFARGCNPATFNGYFMGSSRRTRPLFVCKNKYSSFCCTCLLLCVYLLATRLVYLGGESCRSVSKSSDIGRDMSSDRRGERAAGGVARMGGGSGLQVSRRGLVPASSWEIFLRR